MKLSELQIDIMKHTTKEKDRNWFGTSLNSEDSVEFEKLVKAGYATSEKPPSWMGDDVIYRLTGEGKKAIKNL